MDKISAPSQTYINNFLKSGKIQEKEFAKLFRDSTLSSKKEDMFEHWDVKISYKFDVKGLKKIKRNNDEVDENFHYIEIKNVNGNLGWLYGQADYFVFELKKYWIIVEKIKLQEFIKSNTIKEYVKFPTLNKLYQRSGRNDVITLVSSYDLIFISEKMIEKESNFETNGN